MTPALPKGRPRVGQSKGANPNAAPLMKPKIVRVRIGPYPRPMPEGMFDPMPSVAAVFDNGTTGRLFRFYPDEVSFTPEELVGLTAAEACELHRRKVAELLRS